MRVSEFALAVWDGATEDERTTLLDQIDTEAARVVELAVRHGHTEVTHRPRCQLLEANREGDRLVVMASSSCRVGQRASPRWTRQYVTIHRIVGEWGELPQLRFLHVVRIDEAASDSHDDAAHADRMAQRWRAPSLSPEERVASVAAKARAESALQERCRDSRYRVDLAPIAEVVATDGVELTTWSAFAVTLFQPYEHQVHVIELEAAGIATEHRHLASHVAQYAEHDMHTLELDVARTIALETIAKQR